MTLLKIRFLVLLSLIFIVDPAISQEAVVKLKLSPTGQFDAKTEKIEGQVKINNGIVEAQSIRIPVESLKTGMKLRDEHMTEKYLDAKKYPYVTLHVGKGKNNKGVGYIEIKGIKKKVQGTYKLINNEVEAEFDLKLSDFGITGIRYMGVGVKDEASVKVRMPASQ